MPTRGPIIASAGVSMHSRWAQLSLLHPWPVLSFSSPRDCNRKALLSDSRDDDNDDSLYLHTSNPEILSHVWPFHRENPRRTCISRSRTCIWLVFLMRMQAHAVTCSRLTVAKFFLFSQRISGPLFFSPLLVQDNFFFADRLPLVLYVCIWTARGFALYILYLETAKMMKSVHKIHSIQEREK